jgi:hypothetical protein
LKTCTKEKKEKPTKNKCFRVQKNKMKRTADNVVKTSLDFELSDEQKKVVEFASQTKVCDPFILFGHAGCGKTNVLSKIAEVRFEKGFGWMLCITYSAHLKMETRELAKSHNCMQVESFHSLIANVLWPGNKCTEDKDVQAYIDLLSKPVPHKSFLETISMVAIDEMQDLNPLYVLVIQQLRSFFPTSVSIVGTGEVFQWVYGSLHASSIDFMCYPDKYFEGEKPFAFFSLTKSFRLTQETCEWINENLNPTTIELHYPECWLKYGAIITKFWNGGLSSAKCPKCACIHSQSNPLTCLANYSSSTIALRKVSLMHVRYNDPLIPRTMVNYVVAQNVMILVNGTSPSRYREKYPLVSTPFTDKGLSFRHVAVAGFDCKLEKQQISKGLENPNSEMVSLENWPFAAFCQLYVSCTRPRERLFVFQDAESQPFFTARKPNQLSVQSMITSCLAFHNKSKKQKTSSNADINRLFEFVPQESYLDNMVRASIVATRSSPGELVGGTVSNAPDTAPGVIAHTLVTGFAKYYHRAVIGATYLRCARNMEILDFTVFMRLQVFNKHQSAAINPTWVADNDWCRRATGVCVQLFRHLPPGSLSKLDSKFVCLQKEPNLLPRFSWAGLAGHGGIVTNYGSVYFSFEQKSSKRHDPGAAISFAASFDTVTDSAAQLAYHHAIANCIGYKHSLQQCQSTNVHCFNINPVRGVLERVELRTDASYFIGELLRRKRWLHLLRPEFSISKLALQNNIALPASKHQEAISSLSASLSLAASSTSLAASSTSLAASSTSLAASSTSLAASCTSQTPPLGNVLNVEARSLH